jgi:hypothetical protein
VGGVLGVGGLADRSPSCCAQYNNAWNEKPTLDDVKIYARSGDECTESRCIALLFL